MAVDRPVELSNELVLLREFRRSDAEDVYRAVRSSFAELTQWQSWCHAGYTIEDTYAFIDSRPAAHRQDGEWSFAVFESSSGRFVGSCGINRLEKDARRANLGYWIRTDATGRGYATSAARLVAKFALSRLDLERIEIVAGLGNLASQRVAVKVGATRECVARRRMRVHDTQHDAVVFSLIRGDVSAWND